LKKKTGKFVCWPTTMAEPLTGPQLFNEMHERNVVSWTLLMAGYVDAGEPKMAIWLFVINACSVLANLEVG
jgi:hypothetical protein